MCKADAQQLLKHASRDGSGAQVPFSGEQASFSQA